MPESTVDERRARVLIVDDQEFDRTLLAGLLKPDGYELIDAGNGLQAIELASRLHPDCILLDIVMPELDGIETCRRLKTAPELAGIPVLAMTPHGDRDLRLQAIASGADDFLPKPFDLEEVRLRVRNAIRSKRLYDQVQADLGSLRRLETARDSLTHMVVHDLRQPLTGIKGYTELLSGKLAKAGLDELMSYPRKVMELVDQADEQIGMILDISRLEEGKMPLALADNDLVVLTKACIDALGSPFTDRTIVLRAPLQPVLARCDATLVSRVIQNLLSNAIKFSPPASEISLVVGEDERSAHFEIHDNGPGIPAQFRERIFEKYGQVEVAPERRVRSTGLGLAFCKLAVEAHRGEIDVDGEPGQGTTFRVVLPR